MSLVVLGTVALDQVKTPSGSKKDMLVSKLQDGMH